MKEAASRKKEAHRAMCQNSTEENKRRHNILKNKGNKAVSKNNERRLKTRLLNYKIVLMGCLG